MELETQLQITLGVRLVVAALLGGVIGLERERRGQAAGLGTFALVSLGACAFGLISVMSEDRDDMRIAAGVVEGIGFLGAGLIIQGRASVHGLTTAASLWASAAVGLLIGMGHYWMALITTAIILIILVIRAVRPVAEKLEEIREDAPVDDSPEEKKAGGRA